MRKAKIPTQNPVPTAARGGEDHGNLELWQNLRKLGFAVAKVEVALPQSKLGFLTGFEQYVGAGLETARLGRFEVLQGDSSAGFEVVFFLDSKELESGLQLLQAQLQELGLLCHCKIWISDIQAEAWRRTFPNT